MLLMIVKRLTAFYILHEKVYFNKKFLYVNSICDQAVLDSETLYISYIFSTFNPLMHNVPKWSDSL